MRLSKIQGFFHHCYILYVDFTLRHLSSIECKIYKTITSIISICHKQMELRWCSGDNPNPMLNISEDGDSIQNSHLNCLFGLHLEGKSYGTKVNFLKGPKLHFVAILILQYSSVSFLG
jgi:hypothetical protein